MFSAKPAAKALFTKAMGLHRSSSTVRTDKSGASNAGIDAIHL